VDPAACGPELFACESGQVQEQSAVACDCRTVSDRLLGIAAEGTAEYDDVFAHMTATLPDARIQKLGEKSSPNPQNPHLILT